MENKKFEQLIELIINENEDKARLDRVRQAFLLRCRSVRSESFPVLHCVICFVSCDFVDIYLSQSITND